MKARGAQDSNLLNANGGASEPATSGTLVPPDIICQTMISYNTLLYHRYGYMIS